jgi:hypothetical protein
MIATGQRFMTVHHVFDNHSRLTRCGIKVGVAAPRITANRLQVTCRRCLQTLPTSARRSDASRTTDIGDRDGDDRH